MSQPMPLSLWPREHGAYAQLGVSLLSAFALAPGYRSLGQGLLTASLFLASEPLLVLLGRRGDGACLGRAKIRLGGLLLVGACSGVAGWAGLPLLRLVSLLPAAILGTGLFGLFLARRERTLAGELLASWAFGATALPMAVMEGHGASGRLLALLLAVLFTLGTAMVHGHLVALRRGGAGAPRRFAGLLGAGVCAGAWGLTGRGLLPGPLWLAFLPMTAAAVGVGCCKPGPKALKFLGWTAALCALVGGIFGAVCLIQAP